MRLTTRSSAVAERPRDASCLSVVSFNSIIRRAQSSIIGKFGFIFTAANNMIILFYSLRGGRRIVHAGCNKQHSLMRRRLCGKPHGGPSQWLLARPAVVDPIVRYWPWIAILPSPPSFEAPFMGGVPTRTWVNTATAVIFTDQCFQLIKISSFVRKQETS